jgi:hypothetical protein
LAFTIPITVLLWTHPAGRCSQVPGDGGLSRLLNHSLGWQPISAALLLAGGAVLVYEALAGAV